jgi:excisionase family DNA binding protein
MSTQITATTFLNVNEAAEFLRIAPKTLYGLVSQRRIPFRKAGRRLLFLQSELLEWTRPPLDRRDTWGRVSPPATISPRIVRPTHPEGKQAVRDL